MGMAEIPKKLVSHLIDTPLGRIVAVMDDEVLYKLAFADCEDVVKNTRSALGKRTEDALASYFCGRVKAFQLKLRPMGSAFQQRVWEELQKIPYGKTRSYAEVAQAIGKPTAYRAVALACKANPLAIIIPCHRVIRSGGSLGGYAGGLEKKEWLLQHER